MGFGEDISTLCISGDMVWSDNALADEITDVVVSDEYMSGFTGDCRCYSLVDGWVVINGDGSGLLLGELDIIQESAVRDDRFAKAG